jgi:hypothetical protein
VLRPGEIEPKVVNVDVPAVAWSGRTGPAASDDYTLAPVLARSRAASQAATRSVSS